MGLKLMLLLLAAVVSYCQAGPAPPISRVGIYTYNGRPAVFPANGGKTELYYYYLGYGYHTTTFNGGMAQCSTFKRITNYRRIIIGWGEKCILNGRNGIFEFKAGFKLNHGRTYLKVSVTNGQGNVAFG